MFLLSIYTFLFHLNEFIEFPLHKSLQSFILAKRIVASLFYWGITSKDCFYSFWSLSIKWSMRDSKFYLSSYESLIHSKDLKYSLERYCIHNIPKTNISLEKTSNYFEIVISFCKFSILLSWKPTKLEFSIITSYYHIYI